MMSTRTIQTPRLNSHVNPPTDRIAGIAELLFRELIDSIPAILAIMAILAIFRAVIRPGRTGPHLSP
jgi:hypothetical protein